MEHQSVTPTYFRPRYWAAVLLILLLVAPATRAQISVPGTPASFSQSVRPVNDLETVRTSALNLRAIEAEDVADNNNGMPPRFGVPQPVGIDLIRRGTHEVLPDGSHLYRIRIECPGAKSVNLLFDRFWLPEGGEMYVFKPNGEHLLGAFTSINNKGTRLEPQGFGTGLVYGNTTIVEYIQPAEVQENAIITIAYAVNGYRYISDMDILPSRVYGSSGNCQVNVNCSEGNAWQDEKKGVAMILVNGSRICTGSLINNTLGNGDLLFLTADHCIGSLDAQGNSNASNWSFAWNYESPGCANQNPGALNTTAGATLLANNTETDFALFRLTEDPRAAGYDVYFNGWDRTASPGRNGTGIHHPSGDIKKIATHSQTPAPWTWSGTPSGSHWRVLWDQTPNGHSVTEGGSSGSPLFNANSHIIGQLHGGSSINCNNPAADPGIYGRLDLSWNGYQSISQRRLVDHLDPNGGSAPNTVNGAYIPLTGGGGCSSTVTSFPYTENYESGITWTQSSADNFNWTQNSGGTTSSGTGPSGAAQGTQYAYMEVSSPNYPSRTAIITSPCFDLTSVSNPAISFQYHALGATVGTLRLQASTDGSTWTTIWSFTGDQGSAWLTANVSLNAYTNEDELRLRFNGTSGSSYTGDICLDDIRVGASGGGGGQAYASLPYSTGFESGSFDQYWSTQTSASVGRVQVTGVNGPSGNFHVTLDVTTNNNFSQNEARLHLDLAGESNVNLSFDWKEFNDENHTQDGVFFSDNGGGSFTKVADLINGSATYQTINLDVSALAASNGLSLSSNFVIKFQQYDNYTMTTDGHAIDNINVTAGGGGGGCPSINFNSYTINSYGGGQDQGTHAVQSGGTTLFMQNNAWKSISLNYNVTASTVIEFDFRSTSQGEIHGIGFDNDNGISSGFTFRVYGTQAWGIGNYDNYSGTAWQSYTIPVGSFYTGSFNRLTFTCDNDAAPTSGNAYFRNVKIYEGSCESAAENAGQPVAHGPIEALLGDQEEFNFDVYPVPVVNQMITALDADAGTYAAQLTDLSGRVVWQENISTGEQTHDISQLPAGMYLLRVDLNDGRSVTHKVVKGH
ncbi:MAG: T9SS type A sorting domain-containing protein [Bacteroidota bacterium]